MKQLKDKNADLGKLKNCSPTQLSLDYYHRLNTRFPIPSKSHFSYP